MTRDARTFPAQSAQRTRGADPNGILASIGLVPYDWRIDTDTLTWGANAADVLQVRDRDAHRDRPRLCRLPRSEERLDALRRRDADAAGAITAPAFPYQTEYCLLTGRTARRRSGSRTMAAGSRGRTAVPARAHGVVRAVTERQSERAALAYLSRFDGLTGEMNRNALTETLTASLEEALKYRGSCGFMMIAVDNLARINEAYGFGVADEVIAAVGRRLRSRMRGGDMLGRFSSNKFGVVLKNCTPDDLTMAADRFLAAVREDVVQTAHGPVAATITIGGVAAPRHARTVAEILAHAQESLDSAKAKRRGTFVAYRPNVEREARAPGKCPRDRQDHHGAERAAHPARVRAAGGDRRPREPAFYECLMRIRRADGSVVPANAVIPIAEQLGLVRLIDHRVIELVIAELVADARHQGERERLAGFDHRSGLVVSARRAACAPGPASRSA